MWSDPTDDERHHARFQAPAYRLARWITGRNYLNFGDERPGALRAALGPVVHTRLGELNQRYDSANLFNHLPNVAGTCSASSPHRQGLRWRCD